MGKSILVVREDRTGRHLLQEILRQEGYEIQEATSALDALVIALNSSRPIDLLLTDAGLRGINGWKLAEKLLQAFPATRVVYLVGEAEMQGLGDRHSFTLPTECEPQDLLAVVRRALNSATPKKEPTSVVLSFESTEPGNLKTA